LTHVALYASAQTDVDHFCIFVHLELICTL